MFGNPQQGGLFGQSNTQTSMGGLGSLINNTQPTGFGQPQQQQQGGGGLFQQTQSTGLFGAPQTQQAPSFGGLGSGPSFGQPQQQQATSFGLGFGQGIGQTQPQQGLGTGFGAPQTTQNTGMGLFGSQPQQPTLFGQQQQQQPQQQGLFGQQQPQQPGLFGQPQQQQTGFGQPQQPQQSTFGMGLGTTPAFGANTATNTAFGQGGGGLFQQQPQQQGIFGQQQPTGAFGMGFGQQQQQPQQQQGLGGFGLGGGLGTGTGLGTQNTGFGGGFGMTQQQQPQQFGQGQTPQICQPGGQDDSVNDAQLEQKSKIEDTISAIVWAQNMPNYLATSGWDGKVRIFEIVQQYNKREIQERRAFQMDGGVGNVQNPVLCLDSKSDFSILFCGCGFDNQVKAIDVTSGQILSIGMHQQAVMAVYWIESLNMVMSISFDSTLKLHDPRQPGQTKHQIQFNFKPLVADYNHPLLVIGFSSEKLLILNINELSNARIQYIDSPLGQYSQLTSIQIFAAKDGFGMGSIDGRGHLTNITAKQVPGNPTTEYQLKSIMTFKAHKIEENIKGKPTNYFFPVNSIQFNNKNQQFLMTAGGEGQMIFWDIQVRNKIKTFQFNNNPIVASKMSYDGTMLAYALGNDFSKGPEYIDQFPHKLCIHFVPDNELRCAAR